MSFLIQPGNRRPIIGILASWQVYAGTLNTLLSPILRGIYDAALTHECSILMACGVVTDFSNTVRAAWPLIGSDMDFVPVGPANTDGLILIAPSQANNVQAQFVRNMREAGHPMVYAEVADIGPAVSLDNAAGIRQSVQHLYEHGHRRIAFIGGYSRWRGDSLERQEAFYGALREMNLENDSRLFAEGRFTFPGGYSAMRQILQSGAPFSAVVASNDESAVGAMQALREAGKRIPQDVAIIGFDNRFESRNQTPPLTTVSQPAYEIGWASLELMLRRLAGDAGVETVERVPPRLVIRESCGCSHVSQASSLRPDTSNDEWVNAISDAVHAKVGQLRYPAIHEMTSQLVDGFYQSVEKHDPALFDRVLDSILERVSPLDEDAQAWQVAIHLLRHRWLLQAGPDARYNAVLAWLDTAHLRISDCAQAQLLRYFSRQNYFTRQLSLLFADLNEAVTLPPLQLILDRYLPELGIRHGRLVLYDTSGDSSLAWSLLPAASVGARFPTHSFPPPGMYSDSEPYHLALLPISIQKKPIGYVAFDAANLEPCLAVVRQLTAALINIRLYREAAEGRQLAEEANRLKSRFLSTVSHELRTPLNLIVGWSELLLGESSAHSTPIAGHIHTSAQHLGRLIRDVLDLASSDAGQLRLTCEPLDLGQAFQMVIETGRQMTAEKNLEWRAEISEPLPLVWGDRTRLQQITLNLVSNAIKFTNAGWVMLKISTQNDQVEVLVRDTGLGIPPEEQAWIFDEFRQSERTASRGYGGLGLGLAICKRLVELHGGEVGVESSGEEGSGSTFYFRLPIFHETEAMPAPPQAQTVLILSRQQEAGELIRDRLMRAGFAVDQQAMESIPDWFSRLLIAPPGAVVLDEQLAAEYGWELLKVLKGNPHTSNIPVMFYSLNEKQETGSMLSLDYLMKPVAAGDLVNALARQGWVQNEKDKSKTILIVDDNPGMLEMNTRIVQEHFPAYQVLKAYNGKVALEILAKTPVDLVLLDLMMPEVDGFGVLAQMREWESTRETAVIVLTSKTLTEMDMARLNRGVAMVMGKGLYGSGEMLEHIEAALARDNRLGSESQRLVRKAIVYIHENYHQPLTREDLARYVNASDGHLARCFRQETGLTPMIYLNRYRVNQAQSLLASTDQSITSIALACGFSDGNYFSRVFRQETGLTPLAYRKKHQV